MFNQVGRVNVFFIDSWNFPVNVNCDIVFTSGMHLNFLNHNETTVFFVFF